MAGEQQQHGEGGDPMKVHQDVAVLFKRVAALENMSVEVQLPTGFTLRGKLAFKGESCIVKVQT